MNLSLDALLVAFLDGEEASAAIEYVIFATLAFVILVTGLELFVQQGR